MLWHWLTFIFSERSDCYRVRVKSSNENCQCIRYIINNDNWPTMCRNVWVSTMHKNHAGRELHFTWNIRMLKNWFHWQKGQRVWVESFYKLVTFWDGDRIVSIGVDSVNNVNSVIMLRLWVGDRKVSCKSFHCWACDLLWSRVMYLSWPSALTQAS